MKPIDSINQHQPEFTPLFREKQVQSRANFTFGGGVGVTIREITCKTILNKTTISDYSLNCYTGCAHGCIYCYARFMRRFRPHPEPWGRFADIKANAVEILKRQPRRAVPGAIFVSSACDGWQPIEAEYKLTRQCCDLLLEHGFRIEALTKSSLVLRDLDIFSGRDVRIGVTITSLDERLKRLWEPNSSSIGERFDVISEAATAGVETAIIFGLQHCIYFKCVLNGSNHLKESDSRPMHLCPVCLRKLQYSIGFDVVAHHVKLLRFFKEVGFDGQLQWIEKRLKCLLGDKAAQAIIEHKGPQ